MNLKHRNRSLAIALLGICGGVCGGLQAATITITSISDALNPGGGCTLRGAVAAVNAGADAHGCTATGSYGDSDTVIFSNTLAGQTVQYTAANGSVVIEKPLTIQGPTAAENDPRQRVTLRGIRDDTSFSLLEGHVTLTVRDLDFIEGGGGAIDAGWSSALTATRCAFNKNEPRNSFGGAISAGTVDIDFCTFSDNGNAYYGGAVWAGGGGGTVKNSTFNRNSAASGGALGTSGGTFYIVNSTFSHNTADSIGGAIAGDVVISGSTFIGNKVNSEDGSYGSGGAIHSYGQSSISNSVFSGNMAGDRGGAIYGEGVIDIDGSIFSNNSATTGGAIRVNDEGNARISSTVFSGNSATTGGAIHLSGNLTAHHLTFTDNTAASGPAIYLGDPYDSGQANIVNSTFLGANNNPFCASGTYTGDYNYGWRSVGSGVSDQSCSRP